MLLNLTKQLLNYSFCAASLLLMLSCATTRGGGGAAATTLLVFQQMPCFGTCPAYKAQIGTDGSVKFIPWKHVPVTDTITFQLSARELKELKADVAALDYTNLEDLYKTRWSDMPATHLYFYEGGKEVKHIKHQEGGPEKLTRFNKQLHQLLWKHIANPEK